MHHITLDICDKIAGLFTMVSVVVAIGALWRDNRKHQVERELATYVELSKGYRDFLELCIEHPHIRPTDDVGLPIEKFGPAHDEHILLLEILTSLFESAFFYYHQPLSRSFKTRQWEGWDELIKSWCKRKDFREAWFGYLNSQWDKDFLRYMETVIGPEH